MGWLVPMARTMPSDCRKTTGSEVWGHGVQPKQGQRTAFLERRAWSGGIATGEKPEGISNVLRLPSPRGRGTSSHCAATRWPSALHTERDQAPREERAGRLLMSSQDIHCSSCMPAWLKGLSTFQNLQNKLSKTRTKRQLQRKKVLLLNV